MGQCKCGSYAVNDDPAGLLCDRCWRDAEIARLREVVLEQADLRAFVDEDEFDEEDYSIEEEHNSWDDDEET